MRFTGIIAKEALYTSGSMRGGSLAVSAKPFPNSLCEKEKRIKRYCGGGIDAINPADSKQGRGCQTSTRE